MWKILILGSLFIFKSNLTYHFLVVVVEDQRLRSNSHEEKPMKTLLKRAGLPINGMD